jgi:hypothetical protein
LREMRCAERAVFDASVCLQPVRYEVHGVSRSEACIRSRRILSCAAYSRNSRVQNVIGTRFRSVVFMNTRS